jgi:hypothetical protein
MLSGFGVSESLGQPKIDDIDVMLLLADSNQEVIWLNVPVKEMP